MRDNKLLILSAGYLGGAVLASFGGLVFAMHLASTPRAIELFRGSLGEENTQDDLRVLLRRKVIWGWVDSVAVQGGDIDHLVVTRDAGVLALDSKWRSEWDDRVQGSAVDQARRAARRAQSILRSEGFFERSTKARHRDPESGLAVRPVVVVWGAAARLVETTCADGVQVVPGPDLKSWLATLSGDVIDEQSAHELLTTLHEFRRRDRPQPRD